jgi:hypothetical protein
MQFMLARRIEFLENAFIETIQMAQTVTGKDLLLLSKLAAALGRNW